MLILTGPAMMCAAAGGLEPNDAIAPSASEVPAPPGWSKRQLETAAGSGSGGTFESFIVISPQSSIDSARAEEIYREFLMLEWESVEDSVMSREQYRRGPEGSATLLVMASDLTWDVSSYGISPGPEEFVVMARYEDWGKAAKERANADLMLYSIVLTPAPGLVLLGFRHFRVARSRQPAASSHSMLRE